MRLSTHGLKLVLVLYSSKFRQVMGRVRYVFTSCCHAFLGFSSIGEVELSLHTFVVWLDLTMRSFGFMVQELDEPRKLACLDNITL
jgi:hypothetical protein